MKRTGFAPRTKPLTAKTSMRPRSDKRKASAPKTPARKQITPMQANAKGKQCTLRLPGCRGDVQYTVLCHIRRNGWGGMAKKPDDLLAFFGCDVCHDKEERHHPDCTDADILRAMGETLLIQKQDGLITPATI